MRNILILALVLGIVPGLAGQQPTPAKTSDVRFEVASVKASKSIETGGSAGQQPGGRFSAVNAPLLSMLMLAYGLPGYQVAGGPSWMQTDRYDVDARALNDPPVEVWRLMLQNLLADRFKLSGHFEKRQVDGFALVTVDDKKFGPNLHVAAVDCMTVVRDSRCVGGHLRVGDFKGVGMSLSRLTSLLGSVLGKPVVDDTRLSQPFDMTLQWSSEVSSIDDVPFIFTALQEQLGLRLDAKRVPVDVFVIDHVEQPTPD
jgi:uncharacterized protein (TIGR03435 family)